MKNGNLPFYRLPGTALPTVTGNDVVICETSDGKLWKVDSGGSTEIITGISALEYIFPIGSTYSAFNPNNPTESAVSPAARFPGTTWARITGRVLVGAGTSDVTYAAGATGGESQASLGPEHLPSHDHDPLYFEGGPYGGYRLALHGGSAAPNVIGMTNYGIDQWGASGALKATNVGGNQPHNNMPPYYVVYMWRRTA